jgi:flagellar motor protein MotB
MRNRIIWHILVILFFLIVYAYAQETASVNEIVAEMKKELNLTQEQADAVKPIIEENMAKREELRQRVQDEVMLTDRATIQRKIRELERDENQKLAQILTKEQMNKWIQKQSLRNVFNQDQMNNTRWTSQDERGGGLGMIF